MSGRVNSRASVALSEESIRSFDVTEPCPLDLQRRITTTGQIANFGPDMLALAIAVGPDEQHSSIARLTFDVLGNTFLIL